MLKAIWPHGIYKDPTKINGKFYETIFFLLALGIVWTLMELQAGLAQRSSSSHTWVWDYVFFMLAAWRWVIWKDCNPDLLTSWLLSSELRLFASRLEEWEEEGGRRAMTSVLCLWRSDRWERTADAHRDVAFKWCLWLLICLRIYLDAWHGGFLPSPPFSPPSQPSVQMTAGCFWSQLVIFGGLSLCWCPPSAGLPESSSHPVRCEVLLLRWG